MLFEARLEWGRYRLKSKLYGGVWVLTSSWRPNALFRKLKRPRVIQFLFSIMSIEEKRFKEFIFRSPAWSDSYYKRAKKQHALEHVVDVPYFADSKDVEIAVSLNGFGHRRRGY